MSVQEQLNEGLKLLVQQLAEKNCKLVSTGGDGRGNGYRLAEAAAKSYGGTIPQTATPAELASRMYAFVLQDTNNILVGTPGSGQLVWETKPAKLLAFEDSRGPGRLATHLQEPKAKRVPESVEGRREVILEMERLYSGLAMNVNSPRLSILRGAINECRENLHYDSTAFLEAVKEFVKEPDWKRAVKNMQTFLAAERDGGNHSDNSAVRDVSEFLS
jgi:hypothetical protein